LAMTIGQKYTNWWPAKSNLFRIASVALLIALTIEVVFLTIQNRNLKRTLQVLTGQPLDTLKQGERLEPFTVRTMDGQLVHFDYANSARKYLLFVLSTHCPHCEKNLGRWNSLADYSQDNPLTVFGLSLDDLEATREYITHGEVKFYLTALADTTFKGKYKINGVPETILVSGNGLVERVWVGELDTNQLHEIQELASANAPPIRQTQ
jgi:peroxiredoxin